MFSFCTWRGTKHRKVESTFRSCVFVLSRQLEESVRDHELYEPEVGMGAKVVRGESSRTK